MGLLLMLAIFIIFSSIVALFLFYKTDKKYWYQGEYKGRKILNKYGLERMREIVNSRKSKF